MDALPNVFPGYKKVEDKAASAKFEEACEVKSPKKNGLMMPQMFEGIADGGVKAL